MSKHDTIRKNLRTLTHSQNVEQALCHWKVTDRINRCQSDQMSVCELCGTHFRSGAVVARRVERSKDVVTVTVGGNCLVTLLERQFSEPKEVTKRKAATNKAISERYSGLVDPGGWVTWVYENAPPDLAELVVRLKHVGALRSKSELKKLIAFHDRKRKYSTEAVLPMAEALRAHGVKVPNVITLDQARRLLDGLSSKRLSETLADLGRRFLEEVGATNIDHWQEAWALCTPAQRRLVAALACLSEPIKEPKPRDLMAWLGKHVRLPAIKYPLKAPQFTWHPAWGLCLVSESPGVPSLCVEVFLWGRNEWTKFITAKMRAVSAESPKSFAHLEARAFWDLPRWYLQ